MANNMAHGQRYAPQHAWLTSWLQRPGPAPERLWHRGRLEVHRPMPRSSMRYKRFSMAKPGPERSEKRKDLKSQSFFSFCLENDCGKQPAKRRMRSQLSPGKTFQLQLDCWVVQKPQGSDQTLAALCRQFTRKIRLSRFCRLFRLFARWSRWSRWTGCLSSTPPDEGSLQSLQSRLPRVQLPGPCILANLQPVLSINSITYPNMPSTTKKYSTWICWKSMTKLSIIYFIYIYILYIYMGCASVIAWISSCNSRGSAQCGPLRLEVVRWKGGTSQQQQLHQGPQMGCHWCHLWRILHVPLRDIASETLMFHWNGMCRMPFRSLFRFDPDPNATSTQEWCGWYEANNVDQVMQTGAMGLLALVCVDISWRRMPKPFYKVRKSVFQYLSLCGVSVEYVGVRGRPFTVTLEIFIWSSGKCSAKCLPAIQLTKNWPRLAKPSREVWCV